MGNRNNNKKSLSKSILLWVLALAITLGAAAYQKRTGPTYPVDGEAQIGSQTVAYVLSRSYGGDGDQPVTIAVPDGAITGSVHFKRLGTSDEFTIVPMTLIGDSLKASLPHQPPAGKLEYFVELTLGEKTIAIPSDRSIVTRFKGAVPPHVLIPHIILIFTAMLWSNRAGLEALLGKNTKQLTNMTLLLLLFGGMIMGPIVQKFAFGEFWTGIPWGWDLTDNKTLIAFIGWIAAFVRHRTHPFPRWWILIAALIMLGIFMIPHSMMGSELNYESGTIETG